ncbi:hypothetical protein JCM10908_000791 [Rhodotorula pacifica]|uniref:membrane insertase OXA1 n=1 Tax=Rhodotorula pacifica TaxID=1495444 RepID=UPI00316BF843
MAAPSSSLRRTAATHFSPAHAAALRTALFSTARLSLPTWSRSPLRRGFASSTSARAGWFGGMFAKQDAQAPAQTTMPKEPEAVIEQTTTTTTTAQDVLATATTATTTAPETAATAATIIPESAPAQHFYDGIATGSLDLTSLQGAWGPHPIMRLESLFLHLHESFPLLGSPGLQWAVLIPVVTLGLRFLLFPFLVRSQKNAARMATIQPQMVKGMARAKEAKEAGDVHGQQMAQLEVQQLMQKHKVNPIANLVFPVAQAAVFMTMFFALRGLSGSGIESLHSEGFAWVQDLAAADPYYILPVASTALTLLSLELGIDSNTQVQTAMTKTMKGSFRVLMILGLFVIKDFSAAILLYWTTNNLISLLQTLILKVPFVRQTLNIPTPPPKPQPGDKDYVKEPTFAEAFRNMQSSAMEKVDRTRDDTYKLEKLKRDFQDHQAGTSSSGSNVYTPRRPLSRPVSKSGVRDLTNELLEGAKGPASNVIQAQPAAEAQLSAAEAMRRRRVAEARKRRLQGR